MAKKEIRINYNNTYATRHSRDYYRGASFHWSGEWLAGAHYISDDYNTDFVVYGQVLLACAQSHLSAPENEPKDFIRDEGGTIIGVVSTYWDFVLSGVAGRSPGIKIIDNYWYTCEDTGVPEDQQVWVNTGVKAKIELGDLTPEEIEILQEPGKEVIREAITQEVGQDANKIMSQKAVTDALDTKASTQQLNDAIQNEVARATEVYQPKGDYATNQKVDFLQDTVKIAFQATEENIESLYEEVARVENAIPTKVSELENDSGYQTKADVDELISSSKDVTPLEANAVILPTTDADTVLSKFRGYTSGFENLRETIKQQNALGKHCYFVYEGPANGDSSNTWWVPTWLNKKDNVCFFKEGIAYECSAETRRIESLDFTPAEREELNYLSGSLPAIDLALNGNFIYPADGYYNSRGVVPLSMLEDSAQYSSEDWEGTVKYIKACITNAAEARNVDQKYINYYYPMYNPSTYAVTWLDEKDRICYIWNGVPYRLDNGKEKEALRITDKEREKLASHEEYLSFIKNVYPKDAAFVYGEETFFVWNPSGKYYSMDGDISNSTELSSFLSKTIGENSAKPCYLACSVRDEDNYTFGYAELIRGIPDTVGQNAILLLPNGCYVSVEPDPASGRTRGFPLSNPFFTDAEIKQRDDKVTAIETTANANREQIAQVQSSLQEVEGKATQALTTAQSNTTKVNSLETGVTSLNNQVKVLPSVVDYLTAYEDYTQTELYSQSESFEITPDRAAGNTTTLTTDDFDNVCKFIIDNYNKPCFISLTVNNGGGTPSKENFRILKTIGVPSGGSAAFVSGSVEELFMVSPAGKIVRLANSNDHIKAYLIDTFVEKDWTDGINQRITTINRKLDTLKTTGDGTKFLSDNGQYVTVTSGGDTPSWDNIIEKPTGLVIDQSYVHTDSNFTAAEKTKLTDIESGAQVNKIEKIKINGTEQTISNKEVNLPAYPTTLPASDVQAWAKAATKPTYQFSEIEGGTLAIDVAKSELVGENADDSTKDTIKGSKKYADEKVKTVSDSLDAYKTSNDAELGQIKKTTNAAITSAAGDGYVSVSSFGNAIYIGTSRGEVAAGDDVLVTARSVKSYVDDAVSKSAASVYRYKGSCTYAELPSNATVGDTYNVTDAHDNVPAGTNYSWNGTAWDSLGGSVNLSSYLTTTDAANTYATKTALATTESNAQRGISDAALAKNEATEAKVAATEAKTAAETAKSGAEAAYQNTLNALAAVLEDITALKALIDNGGHHKAISYDAEEGFNVCGKRLILHGHGVPSADTIPDQFGIPAFIGQMYINEDAASAGLYYAKGTSAVADWKNANS